MSNSELTALPFLLLGNIVIWLVALALERIHHERM